MPRFSRLLAFVAITAFILSACATPIAESSSSSDEIADQTPEGQAQDSNVEGRLVIYSGRSEPLIQPVIDAFKEDHPNVEILLKAGSNSELANALIEEKTNPQADVFITTELFTIQSLVQQDVFQAYLPAGAENLPGGFASPGQTWTGLTRRARVIMYNTDLVEPDELPTSINDLVDPKWEGQIAAAGSTNGSMQAQIAVMRQLLGEEITEAWLQGLIDNGVTFFGGHTDVRKAVGAGEFKLGLVNHYYYHLQKAEGSPVGVVYPDQGDGQIGLITNATSAAIIQGASNPQAARAFLDFLVSEEGQKLFAELNYEYPLLEGVELNPAVQPVDDFRLADVDIAQAAMDFDATFELMENIGLP